jgi:hypothetical protein
MGSVAVKLGSYPPSASKGWHPVTVRLKRQGVTVVTRSGYFVE